MKLTPKNKAHIDALDYRALLYRWRFLPVGDPWFQGETGEYWAQRMWTMRAEPGGAERHVSASTSIGW